MVLYPNPVERGQIINLQFETPYSMDIDFSLTDIQGRILKQHSETFAQGKMNYSLESDRLASGIYMLKIQSEKETKSYKILIH
ncbi:MAG: T9SS type A sorting domain-containing protein [Saprospiraceae bacterium]|nr:T9SS type A sorting domain-containing protein [Saprospiraceae bacterium]